MAAPKTLNYYYTLLLLLLLRPFNDAHFDQTEDIDHCRSRCTNAEKGDSKKPRNYAFFNASVFPEFLQPKQSLKRRLNYFPLRTFEKMAFFRPFLPGVFSTSPFSPFPIFRCSFSSAVSSVLIVVFFFEY